MARATYTRQILLQFFSCYVNTFYSVLKLYILQYYQVTHASAHTCGRSQMRSNSFFFPHAADPRLDTFDFFSFLFLFLLCTQQILDGIHFIFYFYFLHGRSQMGSISSTKTRLCTETSKAHILKSTLGTPCSLTAPSKTHKKINFYIINIYIYIYIYNRISAVSTIHYLFLLLL